MTMLPVPGSDLDVWGTKLNTLLAVSIDGNTGELLPTAITDVGGYLKPTGGIPSTDMTTAVQTSLGLANTSIQSFQPNPHAIFLAPLGGGLDDTPQIRTAINNAVTNAVTRGDCYAEVWFTPGIYQILGALVQGGATKGNSQIPLPIIAPTAQKVVLALRSNYGGDTLPHWTQTVGQKAGAVLYATVAGTNDGTFGEASVLGGPTPIQGYGNSTDNGGGFVFNNIHVVLDGLSIVWGGGTKFDPQICGFDFRGCDELTIGAAGAFCDQGTPAIAGASPPTVAWTFPLGPPNQGNNDIVNIRSWSCEHWYQGFMVTEHVVAQSVRVVYCQQGIVGLSQGYAHSNVILYASVEACPVSVNWASYMWMEILVLDVEDDPGTPYAPFAHISDAGNSARGYVGFTISGPGGAGEGTEPTVNGAANLKIVNLGRKSAVLTTSNGAPAVPTSNTAQKNPFWRDAFVSILGGTVSAVAVSAGTLSGTLATATGCTVPVPSGGSITLTYSAAPTWVWTLI